MLKVNLPNSDIEVSVDFDIRGDSIVYSAAYIDDVEFPAEKLFLANGMPLSDYFNQKLQEQANVLLREDA